MYKFDYATVYYIILQNERECKFLPFYIFLFIISKEKIQYSIYCDLSANLVVTGIGRPDCQQFVPTKDFNLQ